MVRDRRGCFRIEVIEGRYKEVTRPFIEYEQRKPLEVVYEVGEDVKSKELFIIWFPFFLI